MYADVLFPINAEAFTYTVTDDLASGIKTGSRVLAPFKRGHKVGIVTALSSIQLALHSNGEKKKFALKAIKSAPDEEPLVPENILRLIRWAAEYYMSTSGLALKNAVPSAFFRGKKAGKPRILPDEDIKEPKEVVLTDEQRLALSEINRTESGAFLLHGVTGSGKTEIYIRAIESLPEGKTAIVLVPEIAITAQMIERFRNRFGDEAAFFHSALSTGERIVQWKKMREGRAKVVVGVRSAVFAPFVNPGLIVIDEEHEASYKQYEGLHYNARDVALARAKLEGIKIILGSATPSMEAFYNADQGRIRYLELKKRVNRKPLPHVEIIDMTREEKQSFALSLKLLEGLKENISAGKQSLIMLNRRGYSPFPICTDCGHTYKCPACSITLIYHKDTKTLNCHYCGMHMFQKTLCPKCNGTGIKYLGAGTQKIEEQLRSLIPELSLERMDRDTTRKKLAHYRIVKQMEDKKIDLLLGTQMVAKGHDFPDVTLSAVVLADLALNLPDFRSGERAFQLFTQLAGRAGRGDVTGRAIIQTYEPEHYVFEYVRHHDYKGFYQKEILQRKELSYPPFGKLIRILLSFKTRERAAEIVRDLSAGIRDMDHKGIEILGPSPAPIERIKNLWRWHMILKGKNSRALRKTASLIIEKTGGIKDMKISVDVDPINLL